MLRVLLGDPSLDVVVKVKELLRDYKLEWILSLSLSAWLRVIFIHHVLAQSVHLGSQPIIVQVLVVVVKALIPNLLAFF